MKDFFPIVLTIEMGIAGLIYLAYKDYGKALYWCSGCLINISVTFLMK